MTALPLAPPEFIATAAKAGYDLVGLRMLSHATGMLAYPLMDNPSMLRETIALLQHTGLSVFDIEIVRLNAEFDVNKFIPFLSTGAELDARAIKVAGDDRDASRLANSFAVFCEAAGRFGMTANIEFMPWTAVTNLTDAVNLVKAAGSPEHAGILVDAIHYARSNTTLEQIAAIPRKWLNYAKFGDVDSKPDSMDEIQRQARYKRLLPGEGSIDLFGMLQALPSDLPLSVEVWDERRASVMGLPEWVKRALETTEEVVTHSGEFHQPEAKTPSFQL